MNDNSSLTFETKCWEGDWEFLLKTECLEVMIARNNFNFSNKHLLINNVNNYREVCSYAKKFINKGILTDFYIVEEYAKEAMDFFQLSRESLGPGYIYSISELVGIYLCNTEFLLHFSSDSIPLESTNWIATALNEFLNNDRVKVANLLWNQRLWEAKLESLYENDEFFIGYGFSDQCYLIRTEDFMTLIYNEKNPISERYPKYGGELFEKRVDAWMRNHNFYRITYKYGSYIHQNFQTIFQK